MCTATKITPGAWDSFNRIEGIRGRYVRTYPTLADAIRANDPFQTEGK